MAIISGLIISGLLKKNMMRKCRICPDFCDVASKRSEMMLKRQAKLDSLYKSTAPKL